MLDWSVLPEDLLNIVSKNVEDCFDIVHARSVCNFWRSTLSFPCVLRRPSYSLPSFANFPSESKHLCTLEKIPLFLFRVQTPPRASASDYFLGGIGRDESENLIELPYPLQCSLKVKIQGSDPTWMKTSHCQVLPLGHQYRMIGCGPKGYTCLAFLPLNEEGREEFILLLAFSRYLLVLTSSEMKWKPVMQFEPPLRDIVTFRRMFYATVQNKSMTMMHAFRIDPFSLHVTPMISLRAGSLKYLVPCGNDDELFMVEKFISLSYAFNYKQIICIVGRLHKETGRWVEVNDLGDRVLFIGRFGNVSCSAKELPDGCGVSGDSILFTNELDNGTYAYKYGVDTGRVEDNPNCWRFSGENRVTILSTSPVVSFRVEH
ncbi:F-box/kelch-repeat protein [Raphanus sativus]|nr:F-box/kelch-repeat protein [Raphanus sativus]